jgi:hypothetical protein
VVPSIINENSKNALFHFSLMIISFLSADTGKFFKWWGGGDYIPRQKVESRFGEKSRGDLKVDSWSKNMMKGKGIEIFMAKGTDVFRINSRHLWTRNIPFLQLFVYFFISLIFAFQL